MDFFDNLMMESEVDFMSVQKEIAFFPNNSGYLLEGAENESFFTKIINKISSIITNIIQKITSLFSKKNTEKSIENFKQAAKEDPSLLNKKVQVPNYVELEKTSNKIQIEVMNATTSSDVDAKMKKYKAQRNKLLATSAFVTVTLGSLFAIVTKKKDETIKNLKQANSTTNSNLKKLEGRYNSLQGKYKDSKKDNEKLKNKLEVASQPNTLKKAEVVAKQTKDKVTNSISKDIDELDVIRHKASAQAEIIQDVAKDVMNNISGALKTCTSSKNIISKVSSVSKATNDTVSDVKDYVTGKKSDEYKNDKKEQLESKAKAIKQGRENAKKVLNNPKATKEQKAKAKKYLEDSEKALHALKVQYSSLK